MDYVVCKKILECFDSNNKCSEVLFHFCGANSDRIVFNKNILDDYSLFGSEQVRSWLNLLTMNTNSFKIIKCSSNQCSNMYVNVCLHTIDKLLIADEKEDYIGTKIEDIEILNKLEAHTCFQPNNTVTIIRGDDAKVTLGNNSNIIEGADI